MLCKLSEGECNARLMNEKKFPKSVSLQEHYSMCGHIQTLFANMEISENIFPDYLRLSSANDEMENGNYNMNTENTCNANTEDEFIDHDSNSTENFNKATGLWEFGGKSLHIPKQMNDVVLAK